jgi:peroxiredoxin
MYRSSASIRRRPRRSARRRTSSKYVKKQKITYPILIDRQGENWNRWGQQYWPTVYLIDRRGRVRYRWEGELEYNRAGGEAIMTRCVEELLKEK